MRHQQLVIKAEDHTETVPIEELGCVVIGNRSTRVTGGALGQLGVHGVPVVMLDDRFLPSSVALPVSTHHLVALRATAQISLPVPRQKRLWAHLVKAKIHSQRDTLGPSTEGGQRLTELATQVRSGDPANREAQAARVYWRAWAGEHSFRRQPGGRDLVNSALNYGYTVLRAYLARAIVGSGLLATVGIFHRNRANPFCLADDLIEPLRVLVDVRAQQFLGAKSELTPKIKQLLVGVVNHTVNFDGTELPLAAAIPMYVASLARAIENRDTSFDIPKAQPNGSAE